MIQNEEIRSRLKRKYRSLSKGQKRLAEYILEHWEEAAFMTASSLGEAAGVSESTAVRFAVQMGYDGYPQFQKELAGVVQQKLQTMDRMEDVYGQLGQPQLLENVLKMDMQRIGTTLQNMDGHAFEQAQQMLEGAGKIYIIGLRNSAPLADYLYYNLKMIYENVVLLQSNSEHELLEQMLYIGGKDVIAGISFPRYSMRTLKALEFASSRQAGVITLTDSIHSPLNLYSSCNLIASSDMASVVDSMVAPMSVINAIVTALYLKHKQRVLAHLELVERTLEDYQSFGNDDLDFVEETVELRPFHLNYGQKKEKGKSI
ncbi:MAG: MurR/RpiR family transcriptional regulator [Lachnospiraceae bacterium]|nr:MurR/RpiR family transcriptional regulator [Lachnospiraceae bacterium]